MRVQVFEAIFARIFLKLIALRFLKRRLFPLGELRYVFPKEGFLTEANCVTFSEKTAFSFGRIALGFPKRRLSN